MLFRSLDEVLPLEPVSSAAQADVPVVPAPTREEINDDDQGTSVQVATEPRRSTRTRSTPELVLHIKTLI